MRESESESERRNKKEGGRDRDREKERKPSRDDYARIDLIIIEMKLEYQRMEMQKVVDVDNVALKNEASIFCTPSNPIISLIEKKKKHVVLTFVNILKRH